MAGSRYTLAGAASTLSETSSGSYTWRLPSSVPRTPRKVHAQKLFASQTCPGRFSAPQMLMKPLPRAPSTGLDLDGTNAQDKGLPSDSGSSLHAKDNGKPQVLGCRNERPGEEGDGSQVLARLWDEILEIARGTSV